MHTKIELIIGFDAELGSPKYATHVFVPYSQLCFHLSADALFLNEYVANFVVVDNQENAMFDEITHVEEEISRFRSTTGNLQDYIPLLRLNPFSFGSKKAGEMRDRRDVYLTALNKGLEDRMEKGTHQPCIQANVILDEEAKLNSEELTSISLTMLSGGLDVSTVLLLHL